MSTGDHGKGVYSSYSSWSGDGSFAPKQHLQRRPNNHNMSGRRDQNSNTYNYNYNTHLTGNSPFKGYSPQISNTVAPAAIWSEVSSSSPVTLDDKFQGRVASSINDLKRSPPSWGQRPTPVFSQKRNSNDKQASKRFKDNDYTNNYIHTGELPTNYVRNVKNPVEGYPKLQRLFQLKEAQTDKFACTPYGCRVGMDDMVPTLNKWIHKEKLVFDVIMIGALTENQFIFPLLTQLPLERLCSKPGFLFVWASAKKINELTGLLNSEGWAKKFRRSEELVFVPVNKDSPYYPGRDTREEESLMENTQWHCWMCITGTVRRSSDGHLIHCNVDTDLKIDNPDEDKENQVVPSHIYKVAENFSSATRRLHIIPSRSGFQNPVRPRRGWVIMSPDIIIDNFDPARYRNEVGSIGSNVPQTQEIEMIRPKSPAPRNTQLNNSNNNSNNNHGHNSYHNQTINPQTISSH